MSHHEVSARPLADRIRKGCERPVIEEFDFEPEESREGCGGLSCPDEGGGVDGGYADLGESTRKRLGSLAAPLRESRVIRARTVPLRMPHEDHERWHGFPQLASLGRSGWGIRLEEPDENTGQENRR